MRYTVVILAFLLNLAACTSKAPDPYTLFRKEQFHTSLPIVSIQQLSSIQKVEQVLSLPDTISRVSFLMPFNFRQRHFEEEHHFTHVLPLSVFNPHSSANILNYHRNGLEFDVRGRKNVTNRKGKILSEEQIRTIVRQNLLNRGQDPRLADTPKDALHHIYLKGDQPLQDAAWLLGVLADEFVEILKARQINTTKWNKNYPLHIYIENQALVKQENTLQVDTTYHLDTKDFDDLGDTL